MHTSVSQGCCGVWQVLQRALLLSHTSFILQPFLGHKTERLTLNLIYLFLSLPLSSSRGLYHEPAAVPSACLDPVPVPAKRHCMNHYFLSLWRLARRVGGVFILINTSQTRPDQPDTHPARHTQAVQQCPLPPAFSFHSSASRWWAAAR